MSVTTEERVNAIIKEKGGERLDTSWTTINGRILVRCDQNHEWWVRAASILYSGSWCRSCSDESRRLGLDEAREIAKRRKGSCLSRSYKHIHQKMSWRCAKGHRFQRSMRNVKEGRWCVRCDPDSTSIDVRYTMKRAINRAESAGGRLIGECKNAAQKTTWECAVGHEFQSTGKSIVRREHFCPTCNGRDPVTLESIKAVCRSRGGICLSTDYVNLNVMMDFECIKGHRWSGRWRNVGRGAWCPTCARERGGAEILDSIAKHYNGEILSERYTNCNKHYRWRCKSGHEFSARTHTARKYWCRKCPPPTEEVLSPHELVAQRYDGFVIDSNKGRWRCKQGHTFQASLGTAALVWCPDCRMQSSLLHETPVDDEAIAIPAGRKNSPGNIRASIHGADQTSSDDWRGQHR